jgi:hypothetical protein
MAGYSHEDGLAAEEQDACDSSAVNTFSEGKRWVRPVSLTLTHQDEQMHHRPHALTASRTHSI